MISYGVKAEGILIHGSLLDLDAILHMKIFNLVLLVGIDRSSW